MHYPSDGFREHFGYNVMNLLDKIGTDPTEPGGDDNLIDYTHNGFGRLKYPFRSPDTRPEAVQYDKTFCPNAAWVEERCFFVPPHPTYEPENIELIAEGIKKVAAAYAK